ncbi:universal stress protein [Streptomyces sp. R44]|uniref:Universal stress protein n=1 Tax=Streptomyces sp. R44 TaxID=3238633 RepID=A0AB39STX8_9ACTN
MDGTTDRLGPGRVVVGVDGSPTARTAAMWAAREATLRGIGVCLLHATDTAAASFFLSPAERDRARQSGRDVLHRTADALTAEYPALPVVTELSGRPAPDALRDAAAPSGTIVVGHRGLGGFPTLAFGAVALRVTAAATTPVVVVRAAATDLVEAGAVLAAVRDGDDLGVARVAAYEALLRKVPLRLLHVWRTTPYAVVRDTRPNRTAEGAASLHVHALSDVAELLGDEFPELALFTEGEKNHSVPGVLVEASRHADLLVVGGRRAPGYLGPTLGRTTLGLLQHAHCPVELIPRGGPGHGSTA